MRYLGLMADKNTLENGTLNGNEFQGTTLSGRRGEGKGS